jgi:Flp pilus assembly pilin Flp
MRGALRAFARDERGTAVIEYALVLALVSIAIMAALSELGATLGELYEIVRLGVASIGAS